MPPTGQTITFAIEVDEDQAERLKHWIRIPVRPGDTVAKIAARRGHPEDVQAIVKRNRTVKGKRPLRSGRTILRHHKSASLATRRKDRHQLWVPGELHKSLSFSALAGDEPPRPVDGYAKFSTLDRPERVGVTTFDGYNPFVLEVPIQFEAWADQGGAVQGNEGEQIERDIRLLERMAGRGDFKGANVGPPPVIRISSTNSQGRVVPLISDQFQLAPGAGDGPLWRVAGIEWGDGALRSSSGNRLRQQCTVTLQQHTNVKLATRSASGRNRRRRRGRRG
jgi:hypothetical protein